MKTAGIILIILNIIGFFGCLVGSAGLPTSLFGWIGFLLPAIIGIILISKGSKKK